MLEGKARSLRAPLLMVVMLAGVGLAAAFVGLFAPIYVEIMGESIVRLMALPILVVLGITLAVSRMALLILIVAIRAGADLVLDSSRTGVAGIQIGAGGIINGLVILIALLLMIERPGLLNRQIVVMWAPFFIIALVGVFVSPFTADAVRLYLGCVSNFAIFLSAVCFVRSQDDYKLCVRVVVWSALMPIAYGFYQFAAGTSLFGARIHSTFAHPNVYAFYLNMVMAMLLYMLKSKTFVMDPRIRMLWSGYMLLLLVQLLLTQTRSAWLACFALFAIYGLVFERKYLILVTVFPAIALTIPAVQDRLLDLDKGNEVVQYAQLNSFAWRVYIWESAMAWMEPMRWVTGYGFDAFKNYSNTFFPLAGGTSPGAHNVYVQLLFELGLPGVLAFIWLFAKMLVMLKPMAQIDRLATFTLGLVIVEYVIVAASDNMLYYLPFNWYVWFMLGGAYGVVRAVALAGAPHRGAERVPAGAVAATASRR
jgi:O-antigen ligase